MSAFSMAPEMRKKRSGQFSSVWTIARLTFHEAARRKILLAALLLGIAFLVVYGLGFHFLLSDIEKSPTGKNLLQRNEISNFLLLAGLYVVNFLTIMMTVLTTVDTISGEISTGTIHTVVSKPIRRWEVILGKWLGFAGMLTLYLVMMAGGIMLIVFLRTHYVAPHPVEAVSLIWLNSLMLLSLSLFGGTFLSTLANGVLVFGLYGVAFIGGWIEQIGTFFRDPAASQTAQNIGVITSLVLPSEALWRRAAYEMQSALVSAVGFSPFGALSVPSVLMIGYAVIYLLVMLVLAVRQFKVRDL